MGYRIQEALLKAYACLTSFVEAGRSGHKTAPRRLRHPGDQTPRTSKEEPAT